MLILTHRRLLVTQFTTDLTTEGYSDRFNVAIEAGKEPLRTLATYRRQGSDVFFGQNLVHHGAGRLRVGDPLLV